MSEPEDRKKRLEALNGGPLRFQSDADVDSLRRSLRRQYTHSQQQGSQPIIYRRDLPRNQARPASPGFASDGPVELEKAVKGEEVHSSRGGKAYLIVDRLEQAEASLPDICNKFRDQLQVPESALCSRLSVLCNPEELCPEDVIFIDLETTGLGSGPMFLVGVMLWEEEGFVIKQYLARNYAEEPAITSLSLDILGEKKLLVSFNGKSFDLPYIRTRAIANAIPYIKEPPHLDLLHESRRAWRGKVPDCKLQTLERCICGRTRYGDIPGSEIPEAYHAFVRTSNAAQMVDILKHNALDLLTLADLMLRLPPSR
jgi:uncharacterized protein YprB with RNaseH-like and TPR domain